MINPIPDELRQQNRQNIVYWLSLLVKCFLKHKILSLHVGKSVGHHTYYN